MNQLKMLYLSDVLQVTVLLGMPIVSGWRMWWYRTSCLVIWSL